MSNILIKNIMTEEQINETAGMWHKRAYYPFIDNNVVNRQLVFAGLTTGCGLMQVSGIAYLPDITNKFKKNFLTFLETLKTDGCGTIICTLGQTFFDIPQYEQRLFNLGFKMLVEYPNIRHGKKGGYNQRLYCLIF